MNELALRAARAAARGLSALVAFVVSAALGVFLGLVVLVLAAGLELI